MDKGAYIITDKQSWNHFADSHYDDNLPRGCSITCNNFKTINSHCSFTNKYLWPHVAKVGILTLLAKSMLDETNTEYVFACYILSLCLLAKEQEDGTIIICKCSTNQIVDGEQFFKVILADGEGEEEITDHLDDENMAANVELGSKNCSTPDANNNCNASCEPGKDDILLIQNRVRVWLKNHLYHDWKTFALLLPLDYGIIRNIESDNDRVSDRIYSVIDLYIGSNGTLSIDCLKRVLKEMNRRDGLMYISRLDPDCQIEAIC